MNQLNDRDFALIEAARDALRPNYDGTRFNHTVGAAVLCGSGRIYTGVNVYSIHGACAEQVAMGTAITGEEIIPPCGNCRQILCDYAPDCEVIIIAEGEPAKIRARELLPFAYEVEDF